MHIIKRGQKTIKNLIREHLLSPGNLLRIAGMLTGKVFIGPLKVMLDITSECDMHCIMCWFHSPHAERSFAVKHLPLKKLKELISQLKKLKTKTVNLCGAGEPLLHPEIIEIMNFIRKNNMGIEIMTNGLYLDRKMADYIKEIKVKKIIISLHGANKETFKKIHPLKTGDEFKKIEENLYYLQNIKGNSSYPQLFIINVISSLNYNNVFEMAEIAKKLKADKILFKPLILAPSLPSYLGISLKQMNTLCGNLKRILKDIDIPNNITDYLKIVHKRLLSSSKYHSRHYKSKNSINLCYMPWVYSVIDIEGNVRGCGYTHKNIDNIYKKSFIEIWFGKSYQNFRKGIYCPPTCLGKTIYPLNI